MRNETTSMKFRVIPRAVALAVASCFFAAGSLGAQLSPQVQKDLEGAIGRLAAATDRSEFTKAKIVVHSIAHEAARPGAEAERAQTAKILADAYAKTDLVDPRAAIAEILSTVGGAESVPALALALSNAGSREMARFALTRIPAAEAGQALRAALEKEKDAEFLLALINSLGARRDAGAIGILAAHAAFDRPVALRLAAIEALSRIPAGGERQDILFAALPRADDAARARERLRVFDAIVVLGETLVSAENGKTAAKLFARLLESSSNTQEKCAAIIGLGRAGEAAPVVKALSDPDPKTQGAALEGLRRMPAPVIYAAVADLIVDAKASGTLRARVLRLIAGRKEPDAATLAGPALKDGDADVRKAALSVLEGRGAAEVVRALIDAIREGAPVASEGAVGVLGRIPGDDATAAIAQAAKEASGDAAAPLIRALAQREGAGVAPALLAAAASTSEAVRIAAYDGIGNLRSGEGLAILLGAVGKGEKERQAAEAALVKFSSPEDQKKITDASRKAVGPARATLLSVVGRRENNEAVALLLEAARDADEGIRIAAIEGLSRQKDPAVAAVLVEAAESGPERVRPVAVLGALRFGRQLEEKDRPAALGIYHKALALASRNEERREAIEGIGRIGEAGSLAFLKPYLDGREGSLKLQAAAAVLPIASKLGDDKKDEAIALLKAALPLAPTASGAKAAIERLRKLGVDYDVARDSGFITHWWIAGPISGTTDKLFENDLVDPDALQFPAGQELKASDKTLAWKHHQTPSPQGAVTLDDVMGNPSSSAAYAYAEVTSPDDKRVTFKIGSDDAVVVWHNGKKIHGMNSDRGLTVDEDSVNTRLTPGKNRILIKVVNHGGGWGYCLRITDRQGAPLVLEQRKG